MGVDRDLLQRLPWALRVEIEENITRKDFTQEELAEIQARLVSELSVPEAKSLGRRSDLAPSTCTGRPVQVPAAHRRQNTTEKVGRLFGESERTVRERTAVVEAARKDPKKYGPLLQTMEETGNVKGAHEVLKGRRTMAALKSSDSVEWYTPPEYLDLVREVLGEIDLDPASSAVANRTVKAKRFYTAEQDGLRQPWSGRVFCNPPYGGAQRDFAARLVEEYGEDRIREAVLLLNANAIETAWFRPLWGHTLCFVYGRINFLGPAKGKHGSTHGTVLVYLGPSWKKFAEVFSAIGAVVRKVAP
jgi:hypothetical protein